MATTEQVDRLYQRLIEVLGLDEARTLMELLRISWWTLPTARAADIERYG